MYGYVGVGSRPDQQQRRRSREPVMPFQSAARFGEAERPFGARHDQQSRRLPHFPNASWDLRPGQVGYRGLDVGHRGNGNLLRGQRAQQPRACRAGVALLHGAGLQHELRRWLAPGAQRPASGVHGRNGRKSRTDRDGWRCSRLGPEGHQLDAWAVDIADGRDQPGAHVKHRHPG